MLISVIICTYNRIELLQDALQSLMAQTISNDMYEVIIVDNASTVPVKNCVERFMHANPHRTVRYVEEPRQGLSWARNTGYREARGQYAAYLDDDAKVASDWLARAAEVIRDKNPDIAGGPIHPFYNCRRPRWFLDRYEILTHGEQSRDLSDGYLWGSNIFIRKEILVALNGFNTQMGRKGRMRYEFNGGEEIDFICRARTQYHNLKVHYAPVIIAYHCVAAKKMALGYFFRRAVCDGWCLPRAWEGEYRHASRFKCWTGLIKAFVAMTIDTVMGIPCRSRRQYPFYQNYIIEVVLLEMRRFLMFGYLLAKGCR